MGVPAPNSQVVKEEQATISIADARRIVQASSRRIADLVRQRPVTNRYFTASASTPRETADRERIDFEIAAIMVEFVARTSKTLNSNFYACELCLCPNSMKRVLTTGGRWRVSSIPRRNRSLSGNWPASMSVGSIQTGGHWFRGAIRNGWQILQYSRFEHHHQPTSFYQSIIGHGISAGFLRSREATDHPAPETGRICFFDAAIGAKRSKKRKISQGNQTRL